MAEVLYNEERHEYTLDGEVVPSVTQLAQKFVGMDTSWFEAHPEYAEMGTKIHNELASYFEQGSKMTEDDFTEEKGKVMARALSRAPEIQTEALVYNTKYKYAGTADIVSIKDGKCLAIVDWKTGAHINKLYCRCQLSLYYLALKEMGVDVSETKLVVITPEQTSFFDPFSWAEMQNLLADFTPEDEIAKRISDLETNMSELSFAVEQYEECKKELKELLSKGFVDTNTRKFNGEYFTFAYVPASTRKTLDQKKVEEALGDLTDYMKETPVAATVRIKEI